MRNAIVTHERKKRKGANGNFYNQMFVFSVLLRGFARSDFRSYSFGLSFLFFQIFVFSRSATASRNASLSTTVTENPGSARFARSPVMTPLSSVS